MSAEYEYWNENIKWEDEELYPHDNDPRQLFPHRVFKEMMFIFCALTAFYHHPEFSEKCNKAHERLRKILTIIRTKTMWGFDNKEEVEKLRKIINDLESIETVEFLKGPPRVYPNDVNLNFRLVPVFDIPKYASSFQESSMITCDKDFIKNIAMFECTLRYNSGRSIGFFTCMHAINRNNNLSGVVAYLKHVLFDGMIDKVDFFFKGCIVKCF